LASSYMGLVTASAGVGRSPTISVSGRANDVIVTRSACCTQRNALAMPGRKEVRRHNSSPII
jgi:hypothetical protein